MYNFKFVFLVCILSVNLFAAYKYDNPKLGNISLEAAIWQSNIAGDISNDSSFIDIKKDLNFNKENITSFGLDLKNEISWIPNIYINYFLLTSSSDSLLNNIKYIDNVRFSGSISSSIDYSEISTILYGFLQQGPFEFDMGLNIKKINFTQIIKENRTNGNKITINGPSSFIPAPYIALKIDVSFIDTVLKAEASLFSIGDTQSKDYKYSINYRIMRNMYVSYGYRYNSFKAINKDNKYEKYDINTKGSYVSFKVLF